LATNGWWRNFKTSISLKKSFPFFSITNYILRVILITTVNSVGKYIDFVNRKKRFSETTKWKWNDSSVILQCTRNEVSKTLFSCRFKIKNLETMGTKFCTPTISFFGQLFVEKSIITNLKPENFLIFAFLCILTKF
jgi:hypothetical protein